VRELWSGVPTEVADATGALINRLGKIFRGNPFCIPHPFSVCPILTEKAIEGATVIENGEILKSIFRAIGIGEFWIACARPSRTDPIGHTIRGEAVIIPVHISFLGGNALKLPFFLSSQPTITPPSFWNSAFIGADLTMCAQGISRRLIDELKKSS